MQGIQSREIKLNAPIFTLPQNHLILLMTVAALCNWNQYTDKNECVQAESLATERKRKRIYTECGIDFFL